MLALPILVRLRLEIPADPSEQTSDDQEFLMDTQDIVERWRQEAFQQGERAGFQEGERAGFQQGERAVLLRLLRRRFGALVDAVIELRVATASTEQLEAWAERVLSAATLAELFDG
jgi:flagellar biosynthesis/type III secretory pathway protein FliH